MKTTASILAVGTALLFSSCAKFDPEYKAYLEEKKAKQAATADTGYGSPSASGNNPYGVPSGTPYQSLPALGDNGLGTEANPAAVTGGPNVNIPADHSTAVDTISHTVVKGDTIWGLSKKYNVSQYDILVTNNLQNNNIRIGQVLQIPTK